MLVIDTHWFPHPPSAGLSEETEQQVTEVIRAPPILSGMYVRTCTVYCSPSYCIVYSQYLQTLAHWVQSREHCRRQLTKMVSLIMDTLTSLLQCWSSRLGSFDQGRYLVPLVMWPTFLLPLTLIRWVSISQYWILVHVVGKPLVEIILKWAHFLL